MHFCTLFDSNYVSKGIALYLSLQMHTDDFVLYVMSLDRECKEMLQSCDFKHMIVECIDDICSSELTEAKNNRSRAEFCWTCGSFFTDYFMNKYNLPDITYLDSDLMFYSSPKSVYDEVQMNGASIGLVPHFTSVSVFGKYCVQFVYFKNDDDGKACLRKWRNQCLEWCYSRLEGGKYGDQKYLESFADSYRNVYEVQNRGVGVAYWNMYDNTYDGPNILYKGQTWPVVFFHYSGFNIVVRDNKMIIHHTMYLSQIIRETFVDPYINLLKSVYERYLNIPITDIVVTPLNPLKYFIKTLVHFINKIIPTNKAIGVFNKYRYRERQSPYSESQ